MQGQYQEDTLGALDIGKEFAKSYFLPWERMKYDPTVWNLSRGGINVGELNPFRRGGLVNNRATRGTANLGYKAMGGIAKKFGWASTLAGSESVQDIRSTVGKLRQGIKLDFDTGVVQMKDGIFSGSKMKIRDTKWNKTLMAKEKNIVSKLSTQKNVNKYNLGYNRLENMINKSMDPDRINKLYKAQSSILSSLNREAGIIQGIQRVDPSFRGSYSGKVANKSQKFLSFMATGKKVTYANEAALAGKLAGTRALIGAGNAATVVAKGAMRVGAAAGWANAMYMVGSLMYQGIKMIASPIAAAGVQAVDQTFNQLASFANPEIGGQLELGFISQGAATERQRAVQAISKSRINGRSQFGSKAAMMHR